MVCTRLIHKKDTSKDCDIRETIIIIIILINIIILKIFPQKCSTKLYLQPTQLDYSLLEIFLDAVTSRNLYRSDLPSPLNPQAKPHQLKGLLDGNLQGKFDHLQLKKKNEKTETLSPQLKYMIMIIMIMIMMIMIIIILIMIIIIIIIIIITIITIIIINY